jgi:NADPH:quinone reductase-like Zn-dependent oxidoreductase
MSAKRHRQQEIGFMSRIIRFHELGGPEVLKIEEIDVPPPGPGEIAVEVKAFGLNRAESMFRSGPYVETPDFPARLGYEGAGVVTALGGGRKRLCPWRRGQCDSSAVHYPMGILRRSCELSRSGSGQASVIPDVGRGFRNLDAVCYGLWCVDRDRQAGQG